MIHKKQVQTSLPADRRGFALLIAVIFMSVMLTFGLELASVGYKQTIIASSALGSQYAFYAADAALECMLYADQQQNLFEYTSHDSGNPPGNITCDDTTATLINYAYDASPSGRLLMSERVSLDGDTHCADVMISKPNPISSVTTYLYSQGYNVPCSMVASPSGIRFASRGLSAHY